MRHKLTPIPARHAAEHDRLADDIDSLVADLALLRGDDQADGMLLVLARRALADVARLVSREPGMRHMKRLPAGGPLPPKTVLAVLEDARRALALFHAAHTLVDDETGDTDWLTRESMETWLG